jgi:hypothetical protein
MAFVPVSLKTQPKNSDIRNTPVVQIRRAA